MHRKSGSLERGSNIHQRLARLHVHLSCADNQSALVGRSGT